MLCLLSELSDNPRGDSGDTEDVSHLVTGTELAALAQKEPMLDEAVKKPCAESRLCVWGHTGIPGFPHRPEAYGVTGGTRSKGNVQPAPSWRSLDLKGPNCERTALRHYLRSGLPWAAATCVVFLLRGFGPERGLIISHIPNGPRPHLFNCK